MSSFRSKLAILLQRAIRDYERLLFDPHASPVDIARAHDVAQRIEERLHRSYERSPAMRRIGGPPC